MMGRHKRQQQPFDEGTISPINKFFPIERKIFSDLKVPPYVNINYLDKNRIDKTIDAWLHDSVIFVISAIIGYDHIGWRDGNSNIIETWQGTRLTLKKNTFDDLTTRKSLSDLYRNFFQTDTRRVALGPIKDAIKAVKDDFEKLSPEIQELFHIVFEKTDVAMLMKTFDGTLSNFMCLYSKHKLEIDPILQSKHIKFIVRLPDITGSTNINVVCGRPNGTKNHISKARNTQTTLSEIFSGGGKLIIESKEDEQVPFVAEYDVDDGVDSTSKKAATEPRQYHAVQSDDDSTFGAGGDSFSSSSSSSLHDIDNPTASTTPT